MKANIATHAARRSFSNGDILQTLPRYRFELASWHNLAIGASIFSRNKLSALQALVQSGSAITPAHSR
jgi:hypothetical protein